MEKKRPQLSLNDLHQLRWLLGGSLALISCWAVLYLEVSAWSLLALSIFSIPLVMIRPDLPSRIPAWVDRLAFPAIVSWFAADLYLYGETLPAMVRLDLLLILYRALSYRKRRDDLQLIVLGLFLVVIAGVVTVSIGFAVQIVCFVFFALGLLLVRTLVDAIEGDGATAAPAAGLARTRPSWATGEWGGLVRRLREAVNWPALAIWAFLFGGLVVVSGLLFLAIPRFQISGGFFLDRMMTRKTVSGFTDTLRFGDVSDIQKDESVAVRIDVSDRSRLPRDLYWRMVVLDEYRDQSFRVSTALRAASFGPEKNVSRITGSEAYVRSEALVWTFYVEPGVSRYLPLLGAFRRLAFTEPQTLSISPALQVFVLSRDPATMSAYRVEGMNSSGRIRDPGYARQGSRDFSLRVRGAVKPPTMLGLPLAEAEKAQLQQVVNEIRLTPGAPATAEDFARRACAWLAKKHNYALQMQLPPGSGDVLVRWTVSDQPGHCELFAGAFTLLARTAGFPTRVVGGFLGGTWNRDYLIVKNSDAHAWCEIFDGKGDWLRVDPTAATSGSAEGKEGSGNATASLRDAGGGWSARFDRLRVLWYRRVVNFDQGDQIEIARVIKDTAQSSFQGFRVFFERVVQTARLWLAGPWRLGTGALLMVLVSVPVFAWWGWSRFGRVWWLRLRSAGGRRGDPLRREAGRWLKKLALRGERPGPSDIEKVNTDLLRLRYGARETWPNPSEVFRRARRAARR